MKHSELKTLCERDSISEDEEYWFAFYLPSRELIDIDNNLCNILNYRKEEIIGEDFQYYLVTPILKKYANTLVAQNPMTLKGMRNVGRKICELRFIPLVTKDKELI